MHYALWLEDLQKQTSLMALSFNQAKIILRKMGAHAPLRRAVVTLQLRLLSFDNQVGAVSIYVRLRYHSMG